MTIKTRPDDINKQQHHKNTHLFGLTVANNNPLKVNDFEPTTDPLEDELHFAEAELYPPNNNLDAAAFSKTLATLNPSPQKLLRNNTTISRNISILPRRVTENSLGEPQLVTEKTERYETVSKLGEGGAGEVVLVKDHDIRRMVAMKRIREDQRKTAQLLRFVEEVQTVGQLEHPNIVPIHDVGIDEDGNYYFTMKYVQGQTLESLIQKLRDGDPKTHKQYSFERRTQIFIEILQAVRFAHECGYIHRDIKPANIMLGEYGEVQVMDWGIAKRIHPNSNQPHTPLAKTAAAIGLDEESIQRIQNELHGDDWNQRVFQTQHGDLVGTPAYMAPEQVMGKPLDERSDIYSLCVLYYEFVNLKHYMEHKTTLNDLLFAIATETPIDSEKLSNSHQGPTPREICFFLRKGLQKDPHKRFQTVQEMIAELQANLEGKICVYCPSTFLKRSAHEYGHYLDNHRVLGVVLFCIGLIIFGLGLFQIYTLFAL